MNRWRERLIFGVERAPLELIAHVVENDLPYTEILTADYIMANPWAAAAYGASTHFDDPGNFHEFKPSRIVSYYRVGEGYESEVRSGCRSTPNPQPGSAPHRLPARRSSEHLGVPLALSHDRDQPQPGAFALDLLPLSRLDIEKSASRTTDPVALADTNNPTMHNPACTVCHRVLDPVAGTFQNYFDEGQYKTNFGGIDSLDEFYKEASILEMNSASRPNPGEDRETLTWRLLLSHRMAPEP